MLPVKSTQRHLPHPPPQLRSYPRFADLPLSSSQDRSPSARSRDCGLVLPRGLLRPFLQLLGFGLGVAFALALGVRLRYRKGSLNALVRLTNDSRKARGIKRRSYSND